MTPAPVQRRSPVRGADLIGATLLFSLLLHGILILGLTFHYARPQPSLPTLDVSLVDVANQEAPDRADFLAQASNRGGGDGDRAARPSRPYAGDLPQPSPGRDAQPAEARAPRPQPLQAPQRLTGAGAPQTASAPARPAPEAGDAAEARRQQEMAQLAAELRDRNEAYAKRPRKKFISANTREYAYAAYMRGWVDRIERVGNLNYPEEARRRGLHGELVLSVGLDRDGRIKRMDVIKSSGQPLLDAAAQRIVRLAAPFPPLPAERQRVDELYITRTWQFLPGGVLRGER